MRTAKLSHTQGNVRTVLCWTAIITRQREGARATNRYSHHSFQPSMCTFQVTLLLEDPLMKMEHDLLTLKESGRIPTHPKVKARHFLLQLV